MKCSWCYETIPQGEEIMKRDTHGNNALVCHKCAEKEDNAMWTILCVILALFCAFQAFIAFSP